MPYTLNTNQNVTVGAYLVVKPVCMHQKRRKLNYTYRDNYIKELRSS